MEAKGSQKHPSSLEPNFSVPFKNPSLQWASRRVICQLPGDSRADAKKDPSMLPSPDRSKILIAMKQTTGGKKLECDQVFAAAAAWKKCGGAPAASGDGLKLRPKGTANGESRAMKVAKAVGFSVRLMQGEIMEDFIGMTGKKPPARPKRPPKNARKHLDGIFPGSNLPIGIVAERYGAVGDPVPQ